MKKSTYMDRAMTARDPRYAKILGKLGYERRDMVAEQPKDASETETDDELTTLRAQYQEVVGKRAYHGWSAEELQEKINEASEESGEE